MHDTRSYKIFQGGYVIPAKDDKPADYVKAKPPVFHCQVLYLQLGGILSSFTLPLLAPPYSK